MLIALELENFKGVAKRQRIEFAPLTLLFGANSAGKSTVIQALVYMHELLVHGRTEIDRTTLGGNVVELGGFERLIHRHDRGSSLVLRAEFATPLPLNQVGRDLSGVPFAELDDETDSAWVEITIEYRTGIQYTGPLITRAQIGLGEERHPVVWLELGASLREGDPIYARINMAHPLLSREVVTDANWDCIAFEEDVAENLLAEAPAHAEWPSLDAYAVPLFALSRSRLSALPPVDEALRVVLPTMDDATEEQLIARDQVRAFLEMVILGTTSQLVSALNRSLYIGPLRAVPPRGLLLERSGPVMRWADGLAAWDLLLSDRTTLVERTNEWLRRLEAGCHIVVQRLVDGRASAESLAESHVDSTVRRLLLDTGAAFERNPTEPTLVLPSEVGAGISQMVPIIVAAVLERSRGLALIEQPEIHVHPALQVRLGDLFLDAACRRGQQFLIETHSEHLLLRLMRRMRETTEGTLPDGHPPVQPTDVKVWFVERHAAGCMIRHMPLNERGELVKAWPGGFFEEGLREVL